MRMSAAFTINFQPMPVAYLILLVSFLIFFASYLVFAIGRFPGTRIDRPAMAVIGGALMFAFGVLTPEQGIRSIDFSTLVLLFSMMLIVSSLHLAGFFTWITALAAERLKPGMLLPAIIFTSGVLSAILVNDVVCLAMAPLVLRLCRRMGQRPALYLLALATSSNIGSVATITGNPQNILIGSLSRIGYNQFLARLGPVAVIGLFLDWAILGWFLRRAGADVAPDVSSAAIEHPRFRWLFVPMTVTALVLIGFLLGYPPALVASAGGAILLMRRSVDPRKIYDNIDWALLMFFVGLFLILGGAEQAGITDHLLDLAGRFDLHRPAIFTLIVSVLSNVVSNVPAVILLKTAVARFADPKTAWLMLAMASTLAGNLTITGSVANIIVIEQARADVPIGFLDYLKIGVPVTAVTLAVGLAWLIYFPVF